MASKQQRPTSPHLQIYKLPLTAVISISHRITGVILSVGLLLIVYFIATVSQGVSSYTAMQLWANIWLGKLVYWGFVFALFFHLCHGIRHLFWDLGEGFSVETLNKYAILELIISIALTLGTGLFLNH